MGSLCGKNGECVNGEGCGGVECVSAEFVAFLEGVACSWYLSFAWWRVEGSLGGVIHAVKESLEGGFEEGGFIEEEDSVQCSIEFAGVVVVPGETFCADGVVGGAKGRGIDGFVVVSCVEEIEVALLVFVEGWEDGGDASSEHGFACACFSVDGDGVPSGCGDQSMADIREEVAREL